MTARVGGLTTGVVVCTDPDPVELGLDSEASGVSGSGFLVFARGNAGSGPDGGGEIRGGGREEGLCGIAEVMVAVIDEDIARPSRGVFCSKALLPLAIPLAH